MKGKWFISVLFALVIGLGWSFAWAQNVLITPIGQRTGEFCRTDRALLFEDPTGVRILYDPGRSVAGGGDARLGAVHVMILSSVHADHIGEEKLNADPANVPCGASPPNNPNFTPTSQSNFAEIAAAKNSAVIVGGEMDAFLNKKIFNVLGLVPPATVAGCPAAGLTNEFVVPRASPCTAVLRHGGKRTATMAAGSPGVQIAVVRADHSNGIPRGILADPEKTDLAADNLTAYAGPENGYVLSFTNGLVVYLSGDTGHTGDMATIVNDFYGAKLAVVNMGDIFSMGPEEAAFAVKRLIKPTTVIASHANEVATTNGQVNAGTRTARFIDLVEGIPVHVPLSGVAISCNGQGQCVQGGP